MQLRLTRGLSSLYLRFSADLSLDPVQNVDDLLVFYRSNPSYCVVFFAPRYHELARRSHINLQQTIHDDSSSVALCAFINQLSSIPSETYLQCAFARSLNDLLKRIPSSTMSELAFRDDTYVPYRKSHSYPRSINSISSLLQRGVSPLLRAQHTIGNIIHAKLPSLSESSHRNGGTALFRSLDDLCTHICLALQPRYTITDLKSFVQYGSKIVPRRNCSWEQIISISSPINIVKQTIALSSSISKKSSSIKQRTSSAKKRTPLPISGFTLASPYFPIKYSKNMLQRSGSTLLTLPPKTSRVTSELDNPISSQQSHNKRVHPDIMLLKDLDSLSAYNDSPTFVQNAEKLVSTLNSTSLFDDQSLFTSSCEHLQKKLPSRLLSQDQDQDQSAFSHATDLKGINELQLTNYQSHSISNCSDENKELASDSTISDGAYTDRPPVLQTPDINTMALNYPLQLEHKLSCDAHATQSISSSDQAYSAIPILADNQHPCHEFPNDIDIYDLEVASVAIASPLKRVNTKGAPNATVAQCPHISHRRLGADPMGIEESKSTIRFNVSSIPDTGISQAKNQSNTNHWQKITTSPVPIEVSPSITSYEKKREYVVIGDRSTYLSGRKVDQKACLCSYGHAYKSVDSSSIDRSSAGVFDRKRLKLNVNHAQLNKGPPPSITIPINASQAKTEGLVCESLDGSGHTYLLNTLLLQHSKKHANNKRAKSTGNTLLAPSSSRAESGWRPMTAITIESKNDKDDINPRSRTASKAVAEKKMWRKHLGGPANLNSNQTSKDRGHTRCKVTLDLRIPIIQK